MDLGIEGRRAIVASGSSGIGFETARQFLEEGVRVLITGRNETKLNKASSPMPPCSSARNERATSPVCRSISTAAG